MTTKNFVVKNGLTVGNVTIDAASGNILALNANLGNLAIANFFSGNGNLLSNINGANVIGNISGNISNANYASFAGDVVNSAQPNITSLGNLSALTVTGNIAANGLLTNNLYYANGQPWDLQEAAGANNQIQYNVNNNFAASANFTFDPSTSVLTVTGNVSASNANLGNIATANFFTGTLTTNAQPNITSVGTLTSLAVTGNVTTGNVSGTTGAFTDVSGNGSSLSAITGANVTGQVANALVAGTVYTAAQPNITSVGTLSSLAVTGNITSNANVVTDFIVGRTTSVSIEATGANSNVFLKPTGIGTVDVWGKVISNVATPVASTDATNKQYVDEVAQGLSPKGSVVAASYAALPAYTYNNGTAGVGATITASANGALTLDGVQPTVGSRVLIKNETAGNAPVNGVYVVTTNNAGAPFVLTRAVDMNVGTEFPGAFVFIETGTVQADTGWVCTSDSPITVGTTAIVFTQFSGAGQYTAGTGLTLTGTQFSISNTAVTAGAYGNGDYNATFTVNAQGQLTAAANVAITANAANLTGTTLSATVLNSSLTSVGNLTSLTVTGNANVGNIGAAAGVFTTVAGSLTTAAQPNVTSVGTLSALTVSGNANVGNIGGAAGVFTANVSAGNLSTGGSLTVTGNATVGNLITSGGSGGNISGANVISANTFTATANISGGALTVTGNANVGNLSTAGTVVATGNISANYFIGNGSQLTGIDATAIQNGSANVRTFANANVTISAAGNANVVVVTGSTVAIVGNVSASNANLGNAVTANFFIGSGANLANIAGANVTGQVGNALVAGTVYTAAQPNITSVGTLTSLSVTGNISSGNATLGNLATANFFTGTLTTNAQPNITSVGTLTSLDVTGNISSGNANLGNLATANFFTGTLTTAAQPNITSVGNLTSLSITGNTSASLVSLATGLSTNRTNVAVTTNTLIDSFDPTSYRTAKYVISASGDNGYQSVETLLVHDGVDSYITIYGSVCSNVTADIIELTSNVNGVSGNVTVYASSSSANALVNLVASYIKT